MQQIFIGQSTQFVLVKTTDINEIIKEFWLIKQ